MNIIACVDKNWGIGYSGKLLTRIPEDLKLFRELTIGKHIIMGRKTMESLPNKCLYNRTNIVLSRKKIDNPDVLTFDSVDKLISYKNINIPDDECWVIGGGEIYHLLLEYCDTAYITFINHEFENVDTYIPNLYEYGFNDYRVSGINTTSEGYKYRFHILKR